MLREDFGSSTAQECFDEIVAAPAKLIAIFSATAQKQHCLTSLIARGDTLYCTLGDVQHRSNGTPEGWEPITLSRHIWHALTRLSAPTVKSEGKTTLAALIRSIAEYSADQQSRFLILDDADCIAIDAQEEAVAFFKALADALPARCKLIVAGRWQSLTGWETLVTSGKAALIGHEGALTGQVEVNAFGVGRVFSDGRYITIWDGPLPRSLFFFFIDRPILDRHAIFGTFWPEMNQREATNVFHVTKRKVAERIGYDLMTYSSGLYRRVTDVEVRYDVVQFEQAMAEAERDPDNYEAYQRAVRLHRAPYLHGMTAPWAVERRAQLQTHYANALFSLGVVYRRDDPVKAISYFERVQREFPAREDSYVQAMKLLADSGRTHDALAQYDRLESQVRRMYDIDPGRAARDLVGRLRG